uniref:Putative ovule protein n=1 Tax=Solanum chacoense TaxID=4108 RepID=A0A0V0GZU4_SOLCH
MKDTLFCCYSVVCSLYTVHFFFFEMLQNVQCLHCFFFLTLNFQSAMYSSYYRKIIRETKQAESNKDRVTILEKQS